jgi:hypothetical protein
MSLATFKRKSINSMSSAAKRSGKPTNEYWMYSGPFGQPRDNLPSTIFQASLQGFNNNTNSMNYYTASNSGFSVTGPYRNRGGVGGNMRFSKSATPFRGIYPKGWGGTQGRYPQGPHNFSLNILPVITGVAIQNAIVKPPVLSTKGMLARRFRWIHSGQYPNYWVQPVYTGNQTDTQSQGLYVQNKSAANYFHYDVNNEESYVDYFVRCGADYTKTLHQPKDASDYTLRIQRRCQTPLGWQKPFPYAVQTGTGIQRGGIAVTHVASSCFTSAPVVTPPDWYTGAPICNSDGTLGSKPAC